MGLFDKFHQVLRGDTERQLQVKVDNFILKKGKLGEVWEAEEFIHVSGRFAGKRWSCVLNKAKKYV